MFCVTANRTVRDPAPVELPTIVIQSASERAVHVQVLGAVREILAEPAAADIMIAPVGNASTQAATVSVSAVPPVRLRGAVAVITDVPISCAVIVAETDVDGTSDNVAKFDAVQRTYAPLTSAPVASRGVAVIVWL